MLDYDQRAARDASPRTNVLAFGHVSDTLRRGLTFIEAVCAVALLGIVAATVYAAFGSIMGAQERQQQLLQAPNAGALRALGEGQGMVTLRQDAWRKVQAGITTVEEVLRVTDQ